MPNPIQVANTAESLAGKVLQIARVFDVKHYGAKGDGVTNDATAVNAALAAAQAAGGGQVYFPAGHYLYNGAGLVNNPGATTFQPIRLKGDGPQLTTITFEAVSNAECIRLSHQQSMGSGYDYGQGVESLRLVAAQTTKDIIYIKNLEHWHVRDVVLLSGRNGITVEESRFGAVQHGEIASFADIGVKIIGESHCANFFYDLTIIGGTGSDWGFQYIMTSASPTFAGGIYLTNVVVNTSNGGGGFKFAASTVIQEMYVFLQNCVADGAFTTDAFYFSLIRHALLSNCWGVIFPTGSGAGFHYDAVKVVTQIGGEASCGVTGTSDFYFTNSCEDVSLTGVHCDGDETAYKTDATQHTRININNPPFTRAATFSNDYTKLIDLTARARIVTPFTVYGGIVLENAGAFLEALEIADPAAPAANRGRLYTKDNGAGKTQLVVRFPTGAVQVIATEP
jgi:pectate lyase-like protein